MILFYDFGVDSAQANLGWFFEIKMPNWKGPLPQEQVATWRQYSHFFWSGDSAQDMVLGPRKHVGKGDARASS